MQNVDYLHQVHSKKFTKRDRGMQYFDEDDDDEGLPDAREEEQEDMTRVEAPTMLSQFSQ